MVFHSRKHKPPQVEIFIEYNERFFKWLDYKYSRAIRQNILVYPEGHRMEDRNTPGPLKKGMIKYAFERQIDV